MKLIDYVLLAIIAAAVIAAVFFRIRRRKRGDGCCGSCGNCSNCSGAAISKERSGCGCQKGDGCARNQNLDNLNKS